MPEPNSSESPNSSHDPMEFALREADRMRVEASVMKQLGFTEIARFLRKNADDAMRWAANGGRHD